MEVPPNGVGLARRTPGAERLNVMGLMQRTPMLPLSVLVRAPAGHSRREIVSCIAPGTIHRTGRAGLLKTRLHEQIAPEAVQHAVDKTAPETLS